MITAITIAGQNFIPVREKMTEVGIISCDIVKPNYTIGYYEGSPIAGVVKGSTKIKLNLEVYMTPEELAELYSTKLYLIKGAKVV